MNASGINIMYRRVINLFVRCYITYYDVLEGKDKDFICSFIMRVIHPQCNMSVRMCIPDSGICLLFEDVYSVNKKKIRCWFNKAITMNVKYIIIPVNNNTGTCIFTSEFGTHDSDTSTDKLKLICDEIRKHTSKNETDMKIVFRYTWQDISCTFDSKYMDNIASGQIAEIISYKPDMLYFDGFLGQCDETTKNKMGYLLRWIKKLKVGIPIMGGHQSGTCDTETYLALHDIPVNELDIAWIHIRTMKR